jgi:hypothetical protein
MAQPVRTIRELTAMFAPIIFGLIILIFCIQKLYTNPPVDERSFYFFTIGALMGIFVPSPIRSSKSTKPSALPVLPVAANSGNHSTGDPSPASHPTTPERPNIPDIVIDHH